MTDKIERVLEGLVNHKVPSKGCKHKHRIWSRGEFSYLNCLMCGKELRKVYTPNFDYEIDRTFIVESL